MPSSSFKLKNNAVGVIASNLLSTSTTITLISGQGGSFPSLGADEYFPATLVKEDGTVEIVKCTARSGDTLTVTRGQEGTAAIAFSAGDRLELRMTAGAFEEMQAKLTRPQVTGILETVNVSSAAATGTINFDLLTQSVELRTVNATGNWTVNFRASETASLNSVMNIGQSISATLIVPQGATPYYNNVVKVDGVTVTPIWLGLTGAPTYGNASATDSYTYAIIKTADATFKVLASLAPFKS